MMKKKTLADIFFQPLLIFSFFVLLGSSYWINKPNTMLVNRQVVLSSQIVVNDGNHNGFPDLVYWDGIFYLAFRSSGSHIEQNSAIHVLSSDDALHWNSVAVLTTPTEEDIRDPKLVVIENTLFLYALKNKQSNASPYTTIYTRSKNGIKWDAWKDVFPSNWVFWRPKFDGKQWYVAADNRANESALFASNDGMTWGKISTIYTGEFSAEIELSFIPDGLISTLRVQGNRGPDKTLIGFSRPPYQNWDFQPSFTTRLDGAASFGYRENLYVIGRYEPENERLFDRGSFFNKKRTSIFLVGKDHLTHLTDLPGSGDTGYASVVIMENRGYIAYYTSDPEKDYPWIWGQFNPTQIRIAVIDLDQLEKTALEKR